MKKFVSAALSLVLLASLVACGDTSGGNSPTPTPPVQSGTPSTVTPAQPTASDGVIRIGVVCSITHPTVATAGEYSLNGANLAVKEINAAGGILGKQLELVFEDDAGDATTCINAFNKMLENDVVAIAGTIASSNTLAAANVIAQGGLPTTCGGTSVKLGEIGAENLFCLRPSDAITATAAAKFMVEDQGCKKVGILYCTSDFGSGAYQVMSDYYNSVNVNFAAEAYNAGDTDFQAQLLKLSQSEGCDGFIVWGDDNDIAIIVRQMYEMGWDVPSLGSNGLSSALLQIDKEMSNGWFVAGDFCPNNELNQRTVNFRKAYMDAYGIDVETYSATFYSAVWMFADAINACGSTEPDALIAQLSSLDGYEAANAIYTHNKNGQMVDNALIMECKDGGTSVIKTVFVD